MLLELPEYECHRRVRAARIAELALDNEENSRMGTVLLELPGRLYSHRINREWFTVHQPEIGGYLVIGEDGIPSYSARVPFEAMYRLTSQLDTEQLAGQCWNQAEVVHQPLPERRERKRHSTTCPAEHTEGATCTCTSSPWRIA